MSSAPKPRTLQHPRPRHYEFNLAHHWPPAVLSIFHRVSGLLLFFPVLPLVLYLLQSGLGSEAGYARWQGFFAHPIVKAALFLVAWGYAHHFFAGIRYLTLDVHWGTSKAAARASALLVFALGVIVAALVAWRLW